jgi:hypothetical protein
MKILHDTETQSLKKYPRNDGEPVVGLDPRYVVLELIQQEKPDHDPSTHYLRRTEAIDLNASQVNRGWELVAHEPMPVVVSFRALAFVINEAGLYQQVKIAAMSSIEGEIWWNTAQSTTVQRDHPFVAALGAAIGQAPEQLDALFAAAQTLDSQL